MYIGLNEKYSLFFSRLMKIIFSRQIFEKKNIKFLKNSSSWSRFVPCERRTDMKKLIVAFRKFAKAPEKYTGARFFSKN